MCMEVVNELNSRQIDPGKILTGHSLYEVENKLDG